MARWKAFSENTGPFVVHNFERWPTWMWANWEEVALAEWMKDFNSGRKARVGFYGLDVYSLWEAMRAIVDYLDKKDPDMANLARQAYRLQPEEALVPETYPWGL